MFENFQAGVLRQASRIQGVDVFHAESEAPLPVFDVSNRRIIVDKRINLLERGSPSDEFDHITIEGGDVDESHTVAVFLFEITTDFCFGYGGISVSDTSVVVFEEDEEVVATGWESVGTEHSPIIELESMLLTRDGWADKDDMETA